MYVRAISVGYAVPRANFEAVVHSVFHSVVNLKPSGETHLLTVLASGEGDLPQGIRLDTPRDFTFEGLQVGTEARCRGGVLRVDGYPLTIDLRAAECWESDLLELQTDMQRPAVAAAWECAWQALTGRQLHWGSELVAESLLGEAAAGEPAWIRQMGSGVRNTLIATAHCDLEAAREMEPLVGLGPGLTPSGDDLIAGLLVGLWCTTKGDEERLRFLSELGKAVIRMEGRTNDISRTYLFHAAHGQASSRLINLALAICAGADSPEVLERAGAAMRIGHSSGMDAVTGLLLGLTAWDGRQLLERVCPMAA